MFLRYVADFIFHCLSSNSRFLFRFTNLSLRDLYYHIYICVVCGSLDLLER